MGEKLRMRAFLIILLAAAAGCATNERVATIDARLAKIEASIAFEARLAKLETAARLDSAVVVRWHEQVNDARVTAVERRAEALRLEVARLERLIARTDKEAAKPAEVASSSPLTGGDASWYAKTGTGWGPLQHAVGAEMARYFGSGDKTVSFLKERDPNGVPYAPRDPGAKGEGWDGSADLVGKPLQRTRFLSSTGATLDVANFRGKKNVVIVILRGFDPEAGICLACSGQTLALSQSVDEFEKRNAELLLVYPGKEDTVGKFLDAVRELSGSSTPLPLEILLDVDLAVVKEFRIEGKLAKPTTIVVDRQGVVQFAHVGRNKTDRPSVPQLLAVLDRIGK